jgi:hypothetical protein
MLKKIESTVLDGKEITCQYNGKYRHGFVESVKHCVENGYLLTVKTDEGYRGFYLNKTSSLVVLN